MRGTGGFAERGCGALLAALIVGLALAAPGATRAEKDKMYYDAQMGYPEKLRSFELITRPINLKFGEVFNTFQQPIPLPEDVVKEFDNKTMAIVNYEVDVVGYDADGNEFQVPLYDAYNHHYIMSIGNLDDLMSFYEEYKDDPYLTDHDDDEVPEQALGDRNDAHSMMKDYVKETNANQTASTAGFGGASGAEERGTAHNLVYPYAHMVNSPQAFIALLHLINTKSESGDIGGVTYSPLLECPCTPQRTLNVTAGLVDGKPPLITFECNEGMTLAGNPSCAIDTYEGGFRCCEDGVFLVDTDKYPEDTLPESTFYFKFTIYYTNATEEFINVRSASGCCDVTANLTISGNIEHDVPICEEGTPPEACVYELSTTQYLDMSHEDWERRPDDEGTDGEKDQLVELVYAVGHLHVGGLSIDIYDDEAGTLLCHSETTYGNGTAAGDEKSYLVGMSPCIFGLDEFGKPPVLKKSTVIRTVARYNSTVNHHGVMSLFILNVADVDNGTLPS